MSRLSADTSAYSQSELHSAGTPLPSNDIWIGACAVREGATVLTFDGHFGAMRRVSARILEA